MSYIWEAPYGYLLELQSNDKQLENSSWLAVLHSGSCVENWALVARLELDSTV